MRPKYGDHIQDSFWNIFPSREGWFRVKSWSRKIEVHQARRTTDFCLRMAVNGQWGLDEPWILQPIVERRSQRNRLEKLIMTDISLGQSWWDSCDWRLFDLTGHPYQTFYIDRQPQTARAHLGRVRWQRSWGGTGNSSSGEARKNQHVTCGHQQLLGPRDFPPRPSEEKNKCNFRLKEKVFKNINSINAIGVF
jgi:hypothetical protein